MSLAGCASPPVPPAGAQPFTQTYEDRLALFFANPGNFPYSPMEPVRASAQFAPLPAPAASGTAISPGALAAASAYAAASNATAFLVWHDGRIVAGEYGAGIGEDTPLVSKSLSKPLSAIVVGRALALGHIRSLDQKVGDILPELAGLPKGEILVRHLLDMRSGLLDQNFDTDPASHWNQAYLSLDHGSYILDHYPLIDPPGTRYAYSNAVGDFVALVVERATGQRWADFLGREVLAPLGAVGGEIWVNRPGGLAHSGCCMTMPAQSYLRLGILLAQDGVWDGRRLLPEGFVAEMATGTPQNPNYGLGLWLGEPYREYRGFGAPGAPGPQIYQSEPFLDPGLFLFDGNGSQTVHISPANRLVVLRMGPTPPAAMNWDNAFLANTLIRGMAR
jgi:CubicO group peptidase (beta-lactamase class C family)